MVVMPALTKGQQPDDPLIAAAVSGLKRASPEGMTDRIDTPGHMMDQENAYQTTPEQTAPAANGKGNDQGEDNPEGKGTTHEAHDGISRQTAAIDVRIIGKLAQNPANMRVEETLSRAMGITLLIGMGMVFEMRCRPFQGWSFQSHGAKQEQQHFDDRVRTETAMSEHPMKAHPDSQDDQCIPPHQQNQIRPMDRPLPEQPDGEQGREKRDHNEHKDNISIGSDGLHSASALSNSTLTVDYE